MSSKIIALNIEKQLYFKIKVSVYSCRLWTQAFLALDVFLVLNQNTSSNFGSLRSIAAVCDRP